jgi:hypothetical protein
MQPKSDMFAPLVSNLGVAEADKSWISALAPVYLLHKRAGATAHTASEVQELVSMLREALPKRDLAPVLSAISGLPAELLL